jgi:hemerythrin
MANGTQIAKENVEKFEAWLKTMRRADFGNLVHHKKLHRDDMASACKIGKSALRQNPLIKEMLALLEDDLRDLGILPPLKTTESQSEEKPTFSSREVAALEKKIDKLHKENSRLLSENVLLKTEQDKGRVHDGRFSEHILVAHEIAEMLLKSDK